jgi:hypothetical protein
MELEKRRCPTVYEYECVRLGSAQVRLIDCLNSVPLSYKPATAISRSGTGRKSNRLKELLMINGSISFNFPWSIVVILVAINLIRPLLSIAGLFDGLDPRALLL